jgi:hypothetical protein
LVGTHFFVLVLCFFLPGRERRRQRKTKTIFDLDCLYGFLFFLFLLLYSKHHGPAAEIQNLLAVFFFFQNEEESVDQACIAL